MKPMRWFQRLEPIEQTIVKLGVLCACALAVVVALVIAVIALSSAREATGFAQADCQTWRDVATISPAPGASASGLKLYADFRIAYTRKGCVHLLGELPAADPRVAALLPPGVH